MPDLEPESNREKVQQNITTTKIPEPHSGIGQFMGDHEDTEPPPQLTTLPSFPPDASELRRSDMRLVELAVKRGWPLDDKLKKETVDSAAWVMRHGRTHRDRLRAMEFLLAVDKHQLEIVKAYLPQQSSTTTAVQVNVNTGEDLSRLSTEELERRLRALNGENPAG